MLNRKLHILCFTVPYPANYGGVIDLFYMLPALQKAGIRIHLHCFDYGRGKQDVLLSYCEKVNYYSRNRGHKGISSRLPYIVASRNNEQLIENLLSDDAPILMHGIHCSFLLTDKRFRDRNCHIRLHNTEYVYYHQLALDTSSWIKKIYYEIESRLLRKFEQQHASRASIIAVAEQDISHYQEKFSCKHIQHLPVFLPEWKVSGAEGMGNYCLYHGDLQVPSNEKAATLLLTKVFNKIQIPFVIAGRNPSDKLIALAHKSAHTCIVANPSDAEMEDMITRAHIHILPMMIPTGIQLKWLHALYKGRHIVTLSNNIIWHPLAAAGYNAQSLDDLASLVTQLYHQPYTREEQIGREKLLQEIFNADRQAEQLIQIIFTS
ncbi:MAG: mannosyltransferase [Chitinophagia bacterium]